MTQLVDMPEPVRAEGEASEPVDLVIYIDGERHVVGKAGITAKGMIVATIDQELSDPIKQILGKVRGEFTFGLPRMTLSPFAQSLVRVMATEDPFPVLEESDLPLTDDGKKD